jgi:hypothetical protein
MMRTTVNLPDDVYELARSIAGAKRVSMGEALAELVRNSLRRAPGIQTRKAFPCFVVPNNAPPITLEATLRAEDET